MQVPEMIVGRGERIKPPTPWSRIRKRSAISLICLAWFCVTDPSFSWFSAVIGPKSDPSFFLMIQPVFFHQANLEQSMSSIKRDVKKKVLPRPESEKILVSRSSPLSVRSR